MAVALAPTVSKSVPHIANTQRFVFEIPSVLASGSSPIYDLPVTAAAGTIMQFRVAYSGDTQTSFHIGTRDFDFRDTIEEILRAEEIVRCFQFNHLCVIYENTDTAPATTAKGQTGVAELHLIVDNDGATNATGVIQMELIIQAPGLGGV